MKHIVSFSGGKDSTAMLLMMIEKGMRIDEIIFCDTGLEFDEVYEYIYKIEKFIGRKIIVLKPDSTFDDWFYGKWTRGIHKAEQRGFPYKKDPCYWTRESKVKTADKFIGKNIRYLGIAYDEQHRIQNINTYKYPLIYWKMTEQDCKNYLIKLNLLNPLYKYFDRLGCYLCPRQPLKSFHAIYKYFPKEWNKIRKRRK